MGRSIILLRKAELSRGGKMLKVILDFIKDIVECMCVVFTYAMIFIFCVVMSTSIFWIPSLIVIFVMKIVGAL